MLFVSVKVKFLVRFGPNFYQKMIEKVKKISSIFTPNENSFAADLAEAADGLIYISETDAEIIPVCGEKVEAVTRVAVLRLAGADQVAPIEETAADSFFERLTAIRDWFGPRETERAARFARLRDTLYSGLTDLTVYRIGRIRVDIYIVGKDGEGRIAGVRTRAVET